MATMSELGTKWACAMQMTERDRRNTWRFLAAMLAWGITFVAVSWLLKGKGPAISGGAMWAIAAGPIVLSGLAAWMYVKLVRDSDELMRRIQLEGLAYGFGAGMVFSAGYRLLERAGAPSLDINDPMLVMCVFWSLGQVLAMRRYL